MTLKELANRIDRSDKNKVWWECYMRSLWIELGLYGLQSAGIEGVEAYWFRKLHVPRKYENMYTGSAILFYKSIPVCYIQIIDIGYDNDTCECIPVCDFEWFDKVYPKMLVEQLWHSFAERKEFRTTSLTVRMKETYTADAVYQLHNLDLKGASVQGRTVHKCYPILDESSPHYGWMSCCFAPDGPYEDVPLNQFDIPLRLDN